MTVSFHPVGYFPQIPMLSVHQLGKEYVFRCTDINCVVQVQTYHATFADALQQVVSSMRNCPPVQYTVLA